MTEEKKKGFANLSPEKMKEMAALGGRSCPAEKRTYSLNPEFARECARKGGLATAKENRNFSKNRELASSAGRKGGIASQVKKAEERKLHTQE